MKEMLDFHAVFVTSHGPRKSDLSQHMNKLKREKLEPEPVTESELYQ